MNDITYRIENGYAILEAPADFYSNRQEIWQPLPQIGQKYLVVFYCDYDNSEYGENYTVEITEENIIAPALDKRVAQAVAEAVIKTAKETGVARI